MPAMPSPTHKQRVLRAVLQKRAIELQAAGKFNSSKKSEDQDLFPVNPGSSFEFHPLGNEVYLTLSGHNDRGEGNSWSSYMASPLSGTQAYSLSYLFIYGSRTDGTNVLSNVPAFLPVYPG